MVNVMGVPLHTNPAVTGVTVTVAVIGLAPVFIALNDAILPLPLAASPMPGVSFVQLKVVPVPVKLTAAVEPPFTTV